MVFKDPRAAGVRSGERRRRKAPAEPIELPPFTNVVSVQRALELFARAAAQQRGPGAQLGAGVRACEVWMKAEEHRLDLERVEVLEARIRELEGELKAAREPWRRDG